MTNELQEAFIILLVGMTTVFFILFLVVVTGNLLLRWLKSTRFVFNEEESNTSKDSIPNELIEQAIRKWSGGKATVKSIKKV